MNDKLESERKIELNAVISFMIILGIIGLTIFGVIIFKFTKPTSKEVVKEKPRPAVEVMVVVNAKVAILTSVEVAQEAPNALGREVSLQQHVTHSIACSDEHSCSPASSP